MISIAALAVCCMISGDVKSPAGTPVAGARIVLHGKVDHDSTSDAHGHFQVRVDPGSYELVVSAKGFSTADIGLEIARETSVSISLDPADSAHLRPIADVSVDGRLALSRNTIPSVQISRQHLEDAGNDRIIDGLLEVPSVTLPRPDGGAATAPALVALRGPDPSETLVSLDGQILNDGNTGDLDLSRFPVAAFSGVDVTEGLGAKDLNGSNTIGGGVNILSLRPTRASHNAFALSTGSFGATEGWYNLTGTHGRFGYALALDDQQEQGYVHQDALLCTANPCVAGPGNTQPIQLGSTISSRSALANLTWNISQNADVGLRIFSLGNSRDETGVLNAPDVTGAQPGAFIGPGVTQFAQSIRAYDLHGRAPLGAGSLAADVSFSNNSVAYTGGANSPYDVSHQDKRQTLSVSWGRTFEHAEFAFGGYVRNESLAEDGIVGAQSQRISTWFVRGASRPSSRLRLSGAAYGSQYTSFGSSLDARFGASYDLDEASAVRFSVGTGFRAPLLIERYVFPASALPPPNVDCVIVGQGNPNEKPEHATEYELGYGRKLSPVSNLDISAYRTNLRDPIENYYPGNSCGGPPAFSYPINIASVLYEGGAIRFVQRFDALTLTAQYGLNIAYPYNFPGSISNPTSGAYLVNSQQFIGIPQQVGSLGLDWHHGDWHAALDTVFRGRNNELNQGSYMVMNTGVGKRFGKADVTFAVTNVGNDVSGRFTAVGQGVPYVGNAPGSAVPVPIATDRYFVEPRSFRLILTMRN